MFPIVTRPTAEVAMFAFHPRQVSWYTSAAVWSDTVANNWMDPAVPFSMAHYWKLSTFQQVDLSYFLFPPVVVNDPRTIVATAAFIATNPLKAPHLL
jgi:hypothetical protein